jgi:uncharacterized protein
MIRYCDDGLLEINNCDRADPEPSDQPDRRTPAMALARGSRYCPGGMTAQHRTRHPTARWSATRPPAPLEMDGYLTGVLVARAWKPRSGSWVCGENGLRVDPARIEQGLVTVLAHHKAAEASFAKGWPGFSPPSASRVRSQTT